MPLPKCFSPQHRLLILFLLVTLLPASALTWLGWRFLEQDKALELQRTEERLERAVDQVATSLEHSLSEIDQSLLAPSSLSRDYGGHAMTVRFSSAGIEANPSCLLLYRPFEVPDESGLRQPFEAGERFEFRELDYPKAVALFRRLAESEDPRIKAGSLLRLGRNLRKTGEPDAALEVYEDLAQMDAVFVEGVSADLLGRIARCEVLDSLGESEELRKAARDIYQDLLGGHWILDQSSYEFYSGQVLEWLDEATVRQLEENDALVLTAAVEWLWDRWQQVQLENQEDKGRRSLWVRDKPVLAVWQSTPEELIGFVASRPFIEFQWRDAWEARGVRLLLADSDGHVVIGDSEGLGQPQVVRTALEAQLPWTMRATNAESSLELPEFAARRRLLWGGLGIMLLVVIGSVYLTMRAIARELTVARLQSDFVSAISHEFRTPLTSLRHLAELLEEGVVTQEARRQQYYSIFSRETKRLHRLVEGLLNFGRMEAGTFSYRLEVLDAVELVNEVIEEFRQEQPSNGYEIRLQQQKPVPLVKGDREALGRVIWNLLDNAIRYAASSPVVDVEVNRHNQGVAIHVRDFGSGIPAAEQKEIFRKFVRGSTSKSASAKGAGIGLTIVQQIVNAHGGEVTLNSDPGKGSTFSVLLPALEEER